MGLFSLQQTRAYNASMFRIKICGVTCAKDARMVAESGADAIGLNFFPESKRYVSEEAAVSVCRSIPDVLERVGVFVNADAEAIRTLAAANQLDWIQLHGDEPAELLLQLQDYPVIKAFRIDADGIAPVLDYIRQCEALNCRPAAVLLDAYHPSEFGGTGLRIDWEMLARKTPLESGVPWILAGGLTAENAADAIALTQPDAVDTASGVETSPGRKGESQTRSFVQAALAGFSAID